MTDDTKQPSSETESLYHNECTFCHKTFWTPEAFDGICPECRKKTCVIQEEEDVKPRHKST